MPTCLFDRLSCTRALKVRSQYGREFLGEALGMFVLAFFGVSIGAQYVLGGAEGYSSYTIVNIAGGFALMLSIYISQNVSGGCVNPCISLAMCLSGRLAWRKWPVHVVAQVLGAFVAAACVFAVYHEKIAEYELLKTNGSRVFDPAEGGTGGIFVFFPAAYLSAGSGFLDSLMGTMMMVLIVFACIDERNINMKPWFAPLPIGISVIVIGAGTGMNCGYPLNPARDLGPRLFILMAGWGSEAFSYRGGNWFWVPLLGPLAGASVAVFIYWLFVELHWPEENSLGDLELEPSDRTIKAAEKSVNGENGSRL